MSIQRQLMTLIISIVTLATFIAALQGYRNSLSQIDHLFDQELELFAYFLVENGRNYRTPKGQKTNFVYQIFSHGKLVARSARTPQDRITDIDSGFGEATFFGKRWKTFSVINDGLDRNEEHNNSNNNSSTHQGELVIVAHSKNYRIEAAESILLVTIKPIVLSLPFIVLLIYYVIRKSLSPLRNLSLQLENKSSDDLTTVEVLNQPLELEPVTKRLNELFNRLEDAFERERQLSANSAHELRTPVSVLSITSHNLHQSFRNNTLSDDSFQKLDSHVNRMARVIEQIISLYRYSSETFQLAKIDVNIEKVLQDVVANNFDDIEARKQTIALEASKIYVTGDEFALYTMFENIIRNAMNYGGAECGIYISVKTTPDKLMVVIEDSGAGLEDEQLEKITQRFYRGPNQNDVQGSGLGLSIVKHLVNLHKGEIGFYQSDYGGLKVRISLPKDSLDGGGS